MSARPWKPLGPCFPVEVSRRAAVADFQDRDARALGVDFQAAAAGLAHRLGVGGTPVKLIGCVAHRTAADLLGAGEDGGGGGAAARSVHTVYPLPGRCASPPGPRGSPPGSSGPHARALQPLSSDRSVKTPTFAFPGRLPGGAQKARKKQTKTVNMDLSCSDRAQDGLALSGPIAGGAVRAAATADKVLSMILMAAAKIMRSTEASE